MTNYQGAKISDNLLWIDIESTGLHAETDKILEIYALFTDKYLNPLNEWHCIIHYEQKELENISEWAKCQHQELLHEVQVSKISLKEATQSLSNFIDQFRYGKKVMLAGSSVHHDRLFLQHQMPSIVDRLHYRVIDVSTLMELARRWYPWLVIPRKSQLHRAKNDVTDSLNLMRFYKNSIFLRPVPVYSNHHLQSIHAKTSFSF